MLAKKVLVVLIAIAAGLAGSSLHAADELGSTPASKKLRVGIYDSRSVALAFGSSKIADSAIKQLMAEGKQAEKAGDQGRLEVLKKRGNALQNLRHMQVFGNAPIPDILVHMQAVLEKQARAHNLDLIVRDIDIAFQAPAVELVDITKELVDSCQPTKETLNMIEQMKHHPPLPLEQFPVDEGSHKEEKAAANPVAEAKANVAAQEWLKLLDDGKYEQSWKHASAHFQAVVPRDRWVAEMQNLRTPHGKLVSRELKSQLYRTEVPDAPIGEYVVIQFKTVFESKQEATETVTPVREEDGTWKVDGYYIR